MFRKRKSLEIKKKVPKERTVYRVYIYTLNKSYYCAGQYDSEKEAKKMRAKILKAKKSIIVRDAEDNEEYYIKSKFIQTIGISKIEGYIGD